MSNKVVVGIAIASTTAAAIGIYLYWRNSRKTNNERPKSRLRHTLSTEESGNLQRKYLDEFKEDLGNKSFFMGDELSNTDLKIFGQLASIYYVPKTEAVVSMLNTDYPSLVAWMERVKQQLSNTSFKRN